MVPLGATATPVARVAVKAFAPTGGSAVSPQAYSPRTFFGQRSGGPLRSQKSASPVRRANEGNCDNVRALRPAAVQSEGRNNVSFRVGLSCATINAFSG